jgi:hypothetical protein
VVPSEDTPIRGCPEVPVGEESTVVAPQSARFPVIVAERDRTKIGESARPVESTRARAQTAVALEPSADTATAGFLDWNPGAERSVILPHETVVPLMVPVLVRTMLVPPEYAFDHTVVTPVPAEDDMSSSGSSLQPPCSEIC